MAEGSSSATDADSRSTPPADARRLVIIVRVGGGARCFPYQPDTAMCSAIWIQTQDDVMIIHVAVMMMR